MLDIKELIQLSAYLEPATLSLSNKDSISYPKLNIRLTKNNYHYIENALSKLIDTCEKLKHQRELVLNTKKKFKDIELHNSIYEHGNYIIKSDYSEKALNTLISTYKNELKTVQDSYRYLIP